MMEFNQYVLLEEFINIFRNPDFTDSNYISKLLSCELSNAIFSTTDDDINNLISDRPPEEKLSTVLDDYMNQRQIKNDAELCLLSNINKGTFSGIRNNTHSPSIESTMKLIFALKLTDKEITRLLRAAKKFFDPSCDRDLVFIYFLRNKIYDVNALNSALQSLGMKSLTL